MRVKIAYTRRRPIACRLRPCLSKDSSYSRRKKDNVKVNEQNDGKNKAGERVNKEKNSLLNSERSSDDLKTKSETEK